MINPVNAYKNATQSVQRVGRGLGKVLNTKGPSGVTAIQAAKLLGKAVLHVPAAFFDTPGIKKKP